MSDVLYSKLRLEVPQALDGEDATITSSKGATRTVEMSSPITDVMVAGMEKYRVQAGTTDEYVSFGYGEIKKLETTVRVMLKKLPYKFSNAAAVVYNGEIHILGSSDSSSQTKHYKYNGSEWVSVSTLPYSFIWGAAVVFNNEIHILGCSHLTNGSGIHYKWNGSSWTQASSPLWSGLNGNDIKGSSAVVLGNAIHFFVAYSVGYGTYTYYKFHYKWDGSSWSTPSTPPYDFKWASVVVYKGAIHLLGGGTKDSSTNRNHYKWNGSSWTSASTLPYPFTQGSAVVLNDEIHIFGGSGYSTSYSVQPYKQSHYKWNGSSWVSVSTLPYPFKISSAVVWNSTANDEIVLLGTHETNYETYDAQWDGTSWTVGSD